MKSFALTLLSSCAKHHIEKNGTIWRVADNFGWKLDRFNLPPGAATRSREPGIIQQVAQREESSCAERLKVAERKATERVATAEKEVEKWKTLVKKWKKTAADRQLEVCSLRQQNENLNAEIGGSCSIYVLGSLKIGAPGRLRPIPQVFFSPYFPAYRVGSLAPIDNLELCAGVFSS